MSKILITGGSGFLGSHCIVAALAAGHEVSTTLRSLDKAGEVRSMLAAAGVVPKREVTFHSADLGNDEGWGDAVAGCDYILHTASPFPSAQPNDPNDLIVPARDGTLRVLHAASHAGVKRVVLTSSFAAVGYGPQPASHVYTEDDWTPVDSTNPPYILSKAIAERAAWDFIKGRGTPELSVVNPTGIFGPVFGPQLSTSIQIVKGLLDGAFPPELPEMWFGVVDVRDVADLHLRAMSDPSAAGGRFIAVEGRAAISVRRCNHFARTLRRTRCPSAKPEHTYVLPTRLVGAPAVTKPYKRSAGRRAQAQKQLSPALKVLSN